MSNSPDRLTDDAITQFLRTRSADPEFGLLDNIVRTVGATPQDRPWLGLRPILLPRRTLLMIAIALLLATMGAVGVGSLLMRPNLPVVPLPTTPDAWWRVLVETPQGTGSVASLAASPHGLLAVVQGGDRPEGGDGPTRLVVSTDGRNWTLVPEGQHPELSTTRDFGLPSVVGTDRGFLLMQLQEVWMSEDGNDWRRLVSPATDPDLSQSSMRAATAGGPGLVAVGGDKAWYSVDGSDWSAAVVPALPEEVLARPEAQRYVEMFGVTAAGNDLVAWGLAEVPLADNSDETIVVPLLWASSDGRTWVSVVDSLMDRVTAVASGPAGFIAAGEAGPDDAVWFSADGRVWERVAGDAFSSRSVNDDGEPVKLMLKSAAATSAGYVVVGGDGLCLSPCPDQETAIWASVDGRSWSRVPSDDLFSGGWANSAVAWGSRFVAGGVHTDEPAIWISGSER